MKMPERLVFIRHGESELNVISRRLKKSNEEYPEFSKTTPDREFRLSKKGVHQAQVTGEWLSKEYPKGFDIIYVSDFVRAKETCALICKSAGWNDVQIHVDPQLVERNWGVFNLKNSDRRKELLVAKKRDPLYFSMPHGETMLEVRTRTRVLLDRCARQFAGKRVLVISHGEYIEAIWSEIAKLRTETQKKFFESPAGDIKNCQVVEFKSDSQRLDEVRSSNPELKILGDWNKIARETLTPAQLLEEVNEYPHHIDENKKEDTNG